jgi:hypothetical protein
LKSSEVEKIQLKLVLRGGEIRDNILFSEAKKGKHFLYNFLLLKALSFTIY